MGKGPQAYSQPVSGWQRKALIAFDAFQGFGFDFGMLVTRGIRILS